MSDIRFEGVSKHFGAVQVINKLNLEVQERELLVLVGPSGCAKSTTLRMIAGLDSISEGTIYIGGERANHLSPKERNVAMVFQSYALFPNMTVRGNLAFGMQIRGEDKRLVRSEVARIAEMLGLTSYLERKPKELSGGQAQRVALGRAMIRKPRVFLFDEPLSNLDADLRVQMRGEITRLQRSLGTTAVYVTHDQVEAMTMGDRVAVMNKGEIMQVGEPLTLYNQPQNRFVAGFIGSPKMNFIELDAAAAQAHLPNALSGLAPRGCVVGIRPERVRVEQTPAGDNTRFLLLEGRLAHREALGHETLVQVDVASPSACLTSRCAADAAHALAPGEAVTLHVAYDHLFLFDAQNGKRIA